jgi:hypothetical protein
MGLLDSFKKYTHGHWDHSTEGPTLSSEHEQQMSASPQGTSEAQDEDVQRQLQRRRSHDDQAQEQEARQVVQAAAMDIPKQAPAFRKALSMPASYSGPYGSPSSPRSPSSSVSPRVRDNVWHSVFHPGRNASMKTEGASKFDNAPTSSKSVYDWWQASP